MKHNRIIICLQTRQMYFKLVLGINFSIDDYTALGVKTSEDSGLGAVLFALRWSSSAQAGPWLLRNLRILYSNIIHLTWSSTIRPYFSPCLQFLFFSNYSSNRYLPMVSPSRDGKVCPFPPLFLVHLSPFLSLQFSSFLYYPSPTFPPSNSSLVVPS